MLIKYLGALNISFK